MTDLRTFLAGCMTVPKSHFVGYFNIKPLYENKKLFFWNAVIKKSKIIILKQEKKIKKELSG